MTNSTDIEASGSGHDAADETSARRVSGNASATSRESPVRTTGHAVRGLPEWNLEPPGALVIRRGRG
jgi:hypothetical protein